MREKIKRRYTPHEHQIALHKAFLNFRKRVAVTGSRGGKTTAGVADVLDRAILQPGFDQRDIDAGEPYTIVVSAPTHASVQTLIHPPLQRAIPEGLKIGDYHGTKRLQRIRGKHGETHLYYLSASKPEAWQGLKLYGVWIDEFPLVPENMYDEALVRLYDRNGWILLTGTPRGPNWAKTRIYDAYHKKVDPELFFISWKTKDNPFLDVDLELLRQTMPPAFFRRAFEASWDVFEGQIYETYNEQIHSFDPREYRFILPGFRESVGIGDKVIELSFVGAGVDWGYGQGHAGAIVVGGKDTSGRWWILEESVAENLLVSAQRGQDSWINRARALRAKWKIERFYCDHRPENIAQFRAVGLACMLAKKSHGDVMAGIQCVSKFLTVREIMEDGRQVFSTDLRISNACETVHSEIVFYHWRTGSNREEPEKVMDNSMDAKRYLIYTHETRGRFKREVGYQPAG
jgi:hypothetical protein